MKIADYKKPSDWELFFKHRTKYIPLKLLEQKFNTSIDFNILICPDHIAKIDGSKETIIINVKEYHGVKDNFAYLEKQCRRSLDDIIILGDSITPNTVFCKDNPNFKFAGTWFESPVNVVEQTVGPKKYLFDFLVGTRSLHFDYLYETFDKKGLLNPNNLYNYHMGKNPDFDHMDHPLADCWRDLSKNAEGYGNAEENPVDIDMWAEEFGNDSVCLHNSWTSRIVPDKAYKQSLFSIARETQYFLDGDDKFYIPTEKTAKPMLCKRLFFTLGHQYENRNYIELGFKPYDYGNNTWDMLPDWKDRTNKFATYIATLTQDKILAMYETEKDTIQHNYNVATQDWGQICFNFVMERLKIKYS